MIRRLRAYLAARREAARVEPGWETPEGRVELAAIVREVTGEFRGVAQVPTPYTPRHGSGDEALRSDGYEPMRTGAQTMQDTGYLLAYPSLYRERYRYPARVWRAELYASPWGFVDHAEEYKTRDRD
ncbi:hypothetical protein OG792_32970 [Micromonospora sp. NBC_01699]|uniref:hypothetical protein n=1 Tax=Micromonospora sp. NBC_01699 TaxID=2975984 RepID=UPI002E2DA8E2|nr:hypothetical protein [Micromonospora sp. NBC_01699]